MQLLAFWGRYAVAYCGLRCNAPAAEGEAEKEEGQSHASSGG